MKPVSAAPRISWIVIALFGVLALSLERSAPPASRSPASALDLQTIKERMIVNSLPAIAPDETVKTWKSSDIADWMSKLKPDGSFSDLDYKSDNAAAWPPAIHLSRLTTLVQSYSLEGNPRFKDAALLARVMTSLKYWDAGNFLSYNWWVNNIGFPLNLYKILLLLEEKLPEDVRARLLARAERGNVFKSPATDLGIMGQNLVWYCEITIALGVLNNNATLVANAFRKMQSEVRRDGEEGIQADNGFYQHHEVFYSGGYGADFSRDVAKFIALADGTPFRFSAAKIKLLSEYILDGQLWLARGRAFNYSAMGRYYARKGASAISLQKACDWMAKTETPRKKKFEACARNLAAGNQNFAGTQGALSGNKHFWKMDFMAHQRPAFHAGVKMFSKRVYNCDWSPNKEGLKSEELSDGATYIFRTGDEYRDIFPVWDFTRVPGTTEEAKLLPPVKGFEFQPEYGKTTFVGGVSDGTYGAATMDFERGTLSAKKSWFFFDEGFVALGAAISCPGCGQVRTSVNQEWARGPVAYATARVLGRASGEKPFEGLFKDGSRGLDDALWVHHDGVAYVFPEPSHVVAQRADELGTWRSLNDNLSADPVLGKVFSLWIKHGTSPTNASYAYGVFPGVAALDLWHGKFQQGFKILQNDRYAQAVSVPRKKLLMAVFRAKGGVSVSPRSSLTTDQPCAVLFQTIEDGARLAVSNPESKPLFVQITVSGKYACEGCRVDAARNETTVGVLLPAGADAGRSVTVPLKFQGKL
ncbi:MAG: hypothetical protein HYW49_07660 [Deltaproteobacteria bacterium]|nr:hypothetical protein [Deltaproteobacteria bacterium]